MGYPGLIFGMITFLTTSLNINIICYKLFILQNTYRNMVLFLFR